MSALTMQSETGADESSSRLRTVPRLVEVIVLSLLVLTFLAWFVAINVAIATQIGLGSADDGYFALISKYVALGMGYGLPTSSTDFDPFSQYVGVGPAYILVGAAATWLFGPKDWLPGSLTLLTFCLQTAAVGILLAKKVGTREALATILIALMAIALLSAPHAWFFGAYIGEVPAFGWLLLGATLLFFGSSSAIAGAGLCLAFAVLTKQIALFGAIGISFGWLLILLATCGIHETRRRALSLVLFAAVPLVVWELTKLLALGRAGYFATWHATAAFAMPHTVSIGERLQTLTGIFDAAYASPLLLCAVLLLSLISLSLVPRRERVVILAVSLWFGVIAHFAYVALLGPISSRYLWIGIALYCVAVALPLLVVPPLVRAGVIAASLVAVVALDLYKPLLAFERTVSQSTIAEQRKAVAKEISNHQLPLAALSWHSFYDVLYLGNVGEWVQGRDLERLRGREFLAVINEVFTPRDGPYGTFYRAVNGSCASLISHQRYSLFLCDNKFWHLWNN